MRDHGAQRYLESHPSAGLVLINSFPPAPAASARRLIQLLDDAEARAACLRLLPPPDDCVNVASVDNADDALPWSPERWPRRAFDEMCDPANALNLEPCVVPALVLSAPATPLLTPDDVAALVAQHCDPSDASAARELPAHAAHACLMQASVWPVVCEHLYDWYDELF